MHTRKLVVAGTPTAFALALIVAACGGGGGGGSAAPNNIPRFAFLANFDDNTLSAYTVNPATGQLRHNGYVLAGAGPRSIAVDPANKFVYVANQNSGDVSAYSINANGTLSEIDQNGIAAGTTVAAGTGPHSIAMDPSGTHVYVANMGTTTDGTISSFKILDGGALTKIGDSPTGGTPQSVAIDPSGKFLYAANLGAGVSAFGIGQGGALQRIPCVTNCNGAVAGDFAAGSGPFSVAIDPSGRFAYVANFTSGDVSAFKIQSDGTLQQIACNPSVPNVPQTCGITNAADFNAGTNPVSVAVDPTGRFVYTANLTFGEVAAFQIDPAGSGALLTISCDFHKPGCSGFVNFAAGTNPFSAHVDPSGKFLFVANQGSNDVSIFDIDPGTGRPANKRAVRGRVGPAELAMTQGSSPVTFTPKFAYVSNSDDGTVSQYGVGTNGALTPLTPATAAAGNVPESIAVDPGGKFAYVVNAADGDVAEYSIGAKGILTPLVPATARAGSNPLSVAIDPSGRFAYVANESGTTISQFSVADGVLDPLAVATAGTGNTPASVVVDPSGRFAYVTNAGDNTVSQFSIGENGLTPLTPTTAGAGGFPVSVAVDPSGRFAYVTNGGDGTVSQYSVGTDGTLQALAPASIRAGSSPNFIAVDPSGRFAYVANEGDNTVSQFSIGADGTLEALVPASVQTGSFPFSVTVDPSGRFAYVANESSTGTVSQYTIGGNGVLTPIAPATANTGGSPTFIAIAGEWK